MGFKTGATRSNINVRYTSNIDWLWWLLRFLYCITLFGDGSQISLSLCSRREAQATIFFYQSQLFTNLVKNIFIITNDKHDAKVKQELETL